VAAGPDPQSDDIWNFRTLLSQGTFVNIAYQLASANVVLPFIYMAVGAPALFAGVILPIVQISSLVAPLIGAPLFEISPLRKWYLVLSFIVVAASMSVIALAAHASAATVWLVILFLIVAGVVGISQGLSGMAFKDLVGRVVPEARRSSLLFAQTGLAGLFTIAIAFGAKHLVDHDDPLDEHLELLWAGIAVMIMSCLAAALIREAPVYERHAGAPSGAGSAPPRAETGEGFVTEFQNAWRQEWYRHFLILRSFLLSVELATPFYALHAATHHAGTPGSLNVFVIASSAALVVSGFFWRRATDYSIRLVFRLAATMAAVAGLVAIAAEAIPEIRDPWTHGIVFFLIVMARQGSSNARMLYFVKLTDDEERPYFMAISSVTIGVLATVVAFAFGALAHLQTAIWPIWCIVAVNVAAFVYTWRLLETQKANVAAV